MEKQRILLCEDEESLGMLLREYLQAKGYDAELYLDGESGYKAFVKSHFDMCLLDVMMPRMDGFSLAREIRIINQDVPIIFLTAKNLKDDILEGFKLGADDYLTKPFSMDELVYRMEAIMRRVRGKNQKVQTVCRRIEVSVGRTGKRTPVAYFDAVTILGREVCQASLYSEKTASELGIKPGDVIEVGLSNDVTPKVYRVVGTSTGSVAAEPEERWEQRDLFEDGDSESAEGDSTGQKILKGVLMVCSVIGVCVITVLGVALACFGIPLLNGSFK